MWHERLQLFSYFRWVSKKNHYFIIYNSEISLVDWNHHRKKPSAFTLKNWKFSLFKHRMIILIRMQMLIYLCFTLLSLIARNLRFEIIVLFKICQREANTYNSKRGAVHFRMPLNWSLSITLQCGSTVALYFRSHSGIIQRFKTNQLNN